MHTIAIASLLIFVLSGCATIIPTNKEAATTSEWKKGDFHVRFQAGPRGQDGLTYSFYEITHISVSKQEQEMGVRGNGGQCANLDRIPSRIPV